MKTSENLVHAGIKALRLLDNAPDPADAFARKLDSRLRRRSSIRLIRAAGEAVETVDIDVVKDLMKVVKKLRGKENGDDRELDRLKLSLELLQFTLDKKKPTSPDNIVWMFNRIYNKLTWVDKHQDLGKQAVDAIWCRR